MVWEKTKDGLLEWRGIYIRVMNPPFLFTAAPVDVGPVAFSLIYLDADSLFEAVADFTIGLEVNGMRFIQ